MSEVVSLRSGAPIAHPGKPDESVIKAVEELLERVRAGEVIGVAFAATYADLASMNHAVGRCTRAMVGGLFAVMSRVSRDLDEG